MDEAGYYRFPTVHGGRVVFVAEDDLWTIPTEGGFAVRMTASRGVASYPMFSPDGQWLAFTSTEDGPSEVYCMPAVGGPAKRLTCLGASSHAVAWSPNGNFLILATNAAQPFERCHALYQISRNGGLAEPLRFGPASSIAYGPEGQAVLCRNGFDPACWKRYRGGMAGQLWIDEEGHGSFRPLIQLAGNLQTPMWLDGRVYFVSDHEGTGNLYSCLPDGRDIQRHTDHQRFYARNPRMGGQKIVYHCGGDLFVYDHAIGEYRPLEVIFRSPRPSRKPHLVRPEEFLDQFDIHPQGVAVAVTVRGKPFVMANWNGPAVQVGETQGVRYRHVRWLHDGHHLVCVSDRGGEEALEIHCLNESEPPQRLAHLDLGVVVDLKASPTCNQVVLTNQRCELWLVDLETRTAQLLDRSDYEEIQGIDISPDGQWVACSLFERRHSAVLKLCNLATCQCTAITCPVLYDVRPRFDPAGDRLYFLSYRDFDPVYDNVHFALSFPRGVRPYVVTLRADVELPFRPRSRIPPAAPAAGGDDRSANRDALSDSPPGMRVDLEGIERRVVPLPLAEGRYQTIWGSGNKLLYTFTQIEGAKEQPHWEIPPVANATLQMFDLETKQSRDLAHQASSFQVAPCGETVIYRSGASLRVFAMGSEPEDKPTADCQSGWLDLSRVRAVVDPLAERRQMYREAWRLLRDNFWDSGMSEVEWDRIYDRYLPLVDRTSTRAEFSDLLWEMQGDLGSSHAYEMADGVSEPVSRGQGYLGADFTCDLPEGVYRIARIVQGDSWHPGCDSPLNDPGLDVRPGQKVLAVAGAAIGHQRSPHEALVHHGNQEVTLTIEDVEGPRTVVVKTLDSETPARYRDWVERNRAWVHEHSEGRVGYVHLPDMLARGFAEFYRAYLADLDREALVIDVRFNGGGHISSLILETLARSQLGFAIGRWNRPRSYPIDSPAGPLVALVNELTGSDAEIFAHAFQVLRLGPVVGKRTCGAAIGTRPTRALVDGTLTTQPEFAFWFAEGGWDLENRGVVPDIEITNLPQDDAQGRDRQLEAAVGEALQRIMDHPPLKPDLESRPRRFQATSESS